MSLANEVYDYGTEQKSICVTRSHGHETFTNAYNANQLNLAIITPPTGRRLFVSGVYWATAAVAGVIALDFAASAIVVWRGYASTCSGSGADDIHKVGAVDEPLTFNSTTGVNPVFLLVNHRIID